MCTAPRPHLYYYNFLLTTVLPIFQTTVSVILLKPKFHHSILLFNNSFPPSTVPHYLTGDIQCHHLAFKTPMGWPVGGFVFLLILPLYFMPTLMALHTLHVVSHLPAFAHAFSLPTSSLCSPLLLAKRAHAFLVRACTRWDSLQLEESFVLHLIWGMFLPLPSPLFCT